MNLYHVQVEPRQAPIISFEIYAETTSDARELASIWLMVHRPKVFEDAYSFDGDRIGFCETAKESIMLVEEMDDTGCYHKLPGAP